MHVNNECVKLTCEFVKSKSSGHNVMLIALIAWTLFFVDLCVGTANSMTHQIVAVFSYYLLAHTASNVVLV